MKSEWKECTIGEIASVKGGKRLPKGVKLITERNSHPYIRIRDFTEKTLELKSSYEYVDDDTQKSISRYIVDTGDILISIVGTIGLIAIVGDTLKGANLTENCVKLIAIKEDVNKEYLYYFLVSSIGQDEIKKGIVGAVQPKLPIKNIQSIKMLLPPIEIQQQISGLLVALDRKIALNNAINENLEQQAQAIFKSWFVDCEPFGGVMPNDWDFGIVSDLSKEIICGKTPSTKKKEYYGNFMPFITIPDMHNCVYAISTERYLSELGAKSQYKKTLPKNSICISCIGTAGLVVLVAEESQTNQQINSIIPQDGYSPYYIYLLMQTLSEKINRLGQSGSTIVNLNKAQFGIMEALIPSIVSMNEFDSIVQPMFKQILANQQENQRLAALRNTLLPKLMSGEIDVSEVKI